MDWEGIDFALHAFLDLVSCIMRPYNVPIDYLHTYRSCIYLTLGNKNVRSRTLAQRSASCAKAPSTACLIRARRPLVCVRR